MGDRAALADGSCAVLNFDNYFNLNISTTDTPVPPAPADYDPDKSVNCDRKLILQRPKSSQGGRLRDSVIRWRSQTNTTDVKKQSGRKVERFSNQVAIAVR